MSKNQDYGKLLYEESDEFAKKRNRFHKFLLSGYFIICLVLILFGEIFILVNVNKNIVMSLIFGIGLLLYGLMLFVLISYMTVKSYNMRLEIYEKGILFRQRKIEFHPFEDFQEIYTMDRLYEPHIIRFKSGGIFTIGKSHLQSYKPEDFEKAKKLIYKQYEKYRSK